MEKPKEELKETVTVDKAKLDILLQNYESLQKQVSLLNEVADKNEIAKYMDRHRDVTRRTCRVRYLRDEEGNKLIVTGWGNMPTNEVFVGPTGQPVAKQTVKVFIEDKEGKVEEKVYDMLDIGRRYEYMTAEVLERSSRTNDKGIKVEEWKVKADNGKEYLLDPKFLN